MTKSRWTNPSAGLTENPELNKSERPNPIPGMMLLQRHLHIKLPAVKRKHLYISGRIPQTQSRGSNKPNTEFWVEQTQWMYLFEEGRVTFLNYCFYWVFFPVTMHLTSQHRDLPLYSLGGAKGSLPISIQEQEWPTSISEALSGLVLSYEPGAWWQNATKALKTHECQISPISFDI